MRKRTTPPDPATAQAASASPVSPKPEYSGRRKGSVVVFGGQIRHRFSFGERTLEVSDRIALRDGAIPSWRASPGQAGRRILGGGDVDIPPAEAEVELNGLGWVVMSCSRLTVLPQQERADVEATMQRQMQKAAEALELASVQFASFGWATATLFRQVEFTLRIEVQDAADTLIAVSRPPRLGVRRQQAPPFLVFDEAIDQLESLVQISFRKRALAAVIPGLSRMESDAQPGVPGITVAGMYSSAGFAEQAVGVCKWARIGFRADWLLHADDVNIVVTAAHELFHAIQEQYWAGRAPSETEYPITRWWDEGTAEVAAAQALREIDDAGNIRRATDGLEIFKRKDWRIPLWSPRKGEAYRSMEFFAYLDNGNLDYLPALFREIQSRLNNEVAYTNATFFLALRAATANTKMSVLFSRAVARQGRARQGVEAYPDIPPAVVTTTEEPNGNGARMVFLPTRLGDWFDVNSRTQDLRPLQAMAAQSLRIVLPGATRWEVRWSDEATQGADHFQVQARVGQLPEAEQTWLGIVNRAKNETIVVTQSDILDVDILYVETDVTPEADTPPNDGVPRSTSWGIQVRGMIE